MSETRLDPLGILRDTFGYEEFRPHQREVIDAILVGRDVLAVMPTSAGKSLCYQVPALALPGVAIVISPLISLMADQVSNLAQLGVSAAFLNSTLLARERDDVLAQVRLGMLDLLYLAPERLGDDRLIDAARICGVSLVAVDEAHCISQWGNDFRPSYQRIHEFVENLGSRPPICALTATATNLVRSDIVSSLGLRDPLRVVASFDRPNLRFELAHPRDRRDKTKRLLRFVREQGDKSGIVYCQSRKAVEEVADELARHGISCARYHAGLSSGERTRSQEDFIYDRIQVIVATNAFGMGIDKPDVAFVVHYNLPLSVEAYYQEAGRAGRDGMPATCLLLYSPADVHTAEFLISQTTREDLSEQEERDLIAHDSRRLQDMVRYAGSTSCLRHQLLAHFGEDSPERCENCSNCSTTWEEIDRSVWALKVVSCVARLDQRRLTLGAGMVCQILRGSRDQRILGRGLDTLSTYGIMADVSEHEIRILIDELVARRILGRTEGAYPMLTLTNTSGTFLRSCKEGEEPFMMRVAKEPPKEQKRRTRKKDAKTELETSRELPDSANNDGDLYERLRRLRTTLAREQEVPAYIIFNNVTLDDLCNRLPHTADDLLEVTGIGQAKAERFGAAILAEIARWQEEQAERGEDTASAIPAKSATIGGSEGDE